jgi:hypothetical protein
MLLDRTITSLKPTNARVIQEHAFMQGDALTMNSATTLVTSHNTEGKATTTCKAMH